MKEHTEKYIKLVLVSEFTLRSRYNKFITEKYELNKPNVFVRLRSYNKDTCVYTVDFVIELDMKLIRIGSGGISRKEVDLYFDYARGYSYANI